MPTRHIKEKIRILFAEDVLIHYKMSIEILRYENIIFDHTLVSTKEDFIAALANFNPDLVITDYQMPEFNGMEALQLTLEKDPTIPVIILTGSISEEVAVECMRSGAINYVLKENLIRLPFAVNEAITKMLAVKESAKAIQALTESESKLQAITNAAGDAIIMMDNQGLISFWNPAAERIFGFTEQEAIGSDLHKLMAPSECYQGFVDNFLKFQSEGQGNIVGQTQELEARRKDGSRLFISLNLSAVKIKDQWQAVGIISDITNRKKADQELIAAKIRAESGDRLKSAFINNISHEVRTPLNGIIGFSDLMTKPDITDEEKKSFVSMIKSSSKRLLDTMTSYMDISMIVSGNMQVQQKPFEMHQLLHSIYDHYLPLCTVKNIKLDLQIPDPSAPLNINSDESVYTKILSHLLDNAVKFTRKGTISFGYTREGAKITVFVKDTGVGIRKEIQSKIFEQFIQEENSNTRGFDGSGLGLSIVQGLVRLIGGEVGLDSEKGKGCIFSFQVPCEEIISVKLGAPVKPNRIKPVEEHVVLIAEDDGANFIFLKTLLQRRGYEILWAPNGIEAVSFCQKHPEISLVLMDIKLPEMDGFSATRLIKSARPDLAIIAVTAFAMSGDEQKAIEAGCDDYIPKPIIEELLIQKISAFIK
ncbi:MAG: response regulator [Bacteroidales bacterium]|nr:response regulator [Bacteroidales bacterium]